MTMTLHARRVVVDGEERHDRWVTVDGGVVVEIGGAPPAGARPVELGDADLVPGLVDLHSDCLEAKARPRPSTELPLASAIHEVDAEAAAYGITSHFLCVSVEEDSAKHRSPQRAAEVVSALSDLAPALRVDHRVHLRVDVTSPDLAVAGRLVASPVTGLVSYMDHTPGQGQYGDEAHFRAFFDSQGMGAADLDALIAKKRSGQRDAEGVRHEVAALARRHGVTLAAHDDDSVEAVLRGLELGARISEFPVSLDAARAAVGLGLGTVMGAPNLRRGASHVANLSALEAFDHGCLTALASDYHLPSLLAAVYQLADSGRCSWADSVAIVTENPADLTGLTDRGRIEPGRRADLVAVARLGDTPVVRQTWVAGRPVLGLASTVEVA